jgi:hypothetical protein
VPPADAPSDGSRSLRCDRLPRLGSGPTDPAYQGNGHRRPHHWCNVAYASLFAEWVDHTDVGHPWMLSTTPRGDVMCQSLDGVTCLPASTPAAAGTLLRPVVCGRGLLKTQGMTGYAFAQAAHWCQSMEVVRLLKIGRDEQVARSQDGVLRLPLPKWSADQPQTWIVRVRNPGGGWRVWVDVASDEEAGARIGYSSTWDAAIVESDMSHEMQVNHLVNTGGATTDDVFLAMSTQVDSGAAGPAYYVAPHTPDRAEPATATLREPHRLPLRAGTFRQREAALIGAGSGPAPTLSIGSGHAEGRGKSKRSFGPPPEVLDAVVLRRRPPPPPF